jgi:predicted nucleic acid-binding protein
LSSRESLRAFVLDASLAVAWCFEDETTVYTEAVFDELTGGAEALVPPLWPYEVANSLMVAERRNRTTSTKAIRFLGRLAKLPISADSTTDNQIGRAFDEVLDLARLCRLSVYDAAYLELAVRLGLPLASLDRGLRKAAHTAGVALVGGG